MQPFWTSKSQAPQHFDAAIKRYEASQEAARPAVRTQPELPDTLKKEILYYVAVGDIEHANRLIAQAYTLNDETPPVGETTR